MKDLKDLLIITDKISENGVQYYSKENVLKIIKEYSENIYNILLLKNDTVSSTSQLYAGVVKEYTDFQLIKAKEYLNS